ncbi:SBBP repeat-containing protein [uncultured Thiocystis sp.]|jgi:hypothetical protein|uniref:DUF7948 domain-containing protein n=1 Tax=uncultured Thiocystis sp. TaxID=1202134 RepID=UPI0025DD4D98|nr:SBBP repeat-containing protein [uncultured Thiocystis sp.]
MSHRSRHWTRKHIVLGLALLLGASTGLAAVTPYRPAVESSGPLPFADLAVPPSAIAPDTAAKVSSRPNVERLGRLGLRFEPNQGQTHESVRFLARGAGYTLFVTDNELVSVLPGATDASSNPASVSSSPKQATAQTAKNADPGAGVVRIGFVGANAKPRFTGLEQQPGISNYFIGKDPKQWQTKIPSYAQVRAEGLYEGIDLVLYEQQRDGRGAGRLEYDFVLAPGADPASIRLSLKGAEKVHADDEGNLRLTLKGGREIVQHAPKVHQLVDGREQLVEARYVLLKSAGDGMRVAVAESKESAAPEMLVGFLVAAYDRNEALIIDPVLEYATYLGGSGDDNNDTGGDIAVDENGYVYVAANTCSTNFPTINALDPDHNGPLDAEEDVQYECVDAAITKLTPDGSALVYSSYLGGNNFDFAYNITVDSAGSLYLAGQTASPDFPTVNAIDASLNGFSDAFVAKLAPDGSGLMYATYLGGGGVGGGTLGFGLDLASDIAIDRSGSAYVVGDTNSYDFPTVNALYPNRDDSLFNSSDAFVAKLAVDGSTLIYSTYLGGSSGELGTNIAVDREGNAYVAGGTWSTDFPIVNALYPSHSGKSYYTENNIFLSNYDIFVAKITPDGSSLAYSTYLGGSNEDLGLDHRSGHPLRGNG